VYVKVRCVTGPWFVVPAESVRAMPAANGPAAPRPIASGRQSTTPVAIEPLSLVEHQRGR